MDPKLEWYISFLLRIFFAIVLNDLGLVTADECGCRARCADGLHRGTSLRDTLS